MEELKKRAKEVKIIFFDIDDTLRIKDTGFMPDSVNLAFDKLRKKGILTGIATGRNLSGVVPEVRALNPNFYVTANGAYIVNSSGEVVYDNPYSPELAQDLVDWLKSVDSEYVFYGNNELAISKWGDLERDAMQIIYGDLKVDPDFNKSNSVYQILSLSDHDEDLVLPEKFTDKVRRVRWHLNSCDIVPINGNKREGCKIVLDKLGLPLESMMNFGDGPNDLELVDLPGLFVAMEISDDQVLKQADYVTKKVEEDGVHKALVELGIIE